MYFDRTKYILYAPKFMMDNYIIESSIFNIAKLHLSHNAKAQMQDLRSPNTVQLSRMSRILALSKMQWGMCKRRSMKPSGGTRFFSFCGRGIIEGQCVSGSQKSQNMPKNGRFFAFFSGAGGRAFYCGGMGAFPPPPWWRH